jgi:glutamate synthase domain-containing protein 3
MVELEQLDEEDSDTLLRLVRNHLHYTGSPRARKLLEHWTAMAPKFVKVFPHDYKRALNGPGRFVLPKRHSPVEVAVG